MKKYEKDVRQAKQLVEERGSSMTHDFAQKIVEEIREVLGEEEDGKIFKNYPTAPPKTNPK